MAAEGVLCVAPSPAIVVPMVGTLVIGAGETGVVLGDSITGVYGWYAPLETTVAGLIDDVTWINEGVGGDIMNQMLARVGDVTAHEPDFVIIEGGINDVALEVAPATTAEKLTDIIEALRLANPAVRILVCGPWIIGPHIDQRAINEAIRATNTAMRNVAIAEDVAYVDWRLRYDAYFRDNEATALTFDVDGVHPSAAGDTWLSEQVEEQVEVDV